MSRATMRALARALTPFVLVVGLTFGLSPQAVATPVAPTAPAPTAGAPSAESERQAGQQTKRQAKKERQRKRKIRQKRREMRAEKRLERRLNRAVRAASSRRGKPYRYGAAGPHAFDCSGLTQWAYRQAGRSLPRTSGAQAGHSRRIQRRHARPGDLVFFHHGGRVYHVGIFAGGNQIWHAPRPGQSVHKARIWTGSVFFGRVR